MHLLKTENVHSLPNKKPGSVRAYSHRNTKFSNGESTRRWSNHDQDINVSISRRSQKLPYYMIFWRDFNLANLAIFLKIYKLKCTKIKCR